MENELINRRDLLKRVAAASAGAATASVPSSTEAAGSGLAAEYWQYDGLGLAAGYWAQAVKNHFVMGAAASCLVEHS